MGKVQLKIPPWLASMLNAQSSDWLILEKEIEEGVTVASLLADIAASHTDFRKVVFNPDVGKVGDQVNVFLNDNLLQIPDITDTKLNDGDSIMLLPVYSGG